MPKTARATQKAKAREIVQWQERKTQEQERRERLLQMERERDEKAAAESFQKAVAALTDDDVQLSETDPKEFWELQYQNVWDERPIPWGDVRARLGLTIQRTNHFQCHVCRVTVASSQNRAFGKAPQTSSAFGKAPQTSAAPAMLECNICDEHVCTNCIAPTCAPLERRPKPESPQEHKEDDEHDGIVICKACLPKRCNTHGCGIFKTCLPYLSYNRTRHEPNVFARAQIFCRRCIGLPCVLCNAPPDARTDQHTHNAIFHPYHHNNTAHIAFFRTQAALHHRLSKTRLSKGAPN